MIACINPTEIQEGDLLDYATGQASAAVQAHVRRCAHCAAQAAALGDLDHWLLAGLYRASCPAPDALARWQFHLLPAAEELAVAAHVRACPHCTRELHELQAVDDGLLATLLERLPGVSRWREATLIAAVPRPAGLRGVLPPQRRYQADGLEIFVGPQQTSDGRRLLRGHLVATRPPDQRVAGVEVWLAQAGQVLDRQITDEQGYFVFQPIAPGRYDLGFGWQGQAVLVRDVEV